MRHASSLIATLEGMSRPAFRIARELCQNSRSGLTVRFLSKKLELPEEEIEYLVDVNHRLLFQDLTKVRIAPEGITIITRIADGLENRGDIPSLFRLVKSLSAHEFRFIEEQLDIEKPGSKKAAAEALVDRYYKHPEAVVEYVAGRSFSPMAKELFDILWQSEDGIMPVSAIRALHNGSEYEVEQALYELFRSFALFEMFRFDSEDRLVRYAGVLTEIRQWREQTAGNRARAIELKPCRTLFEGATSRGIEFTDTVCRLVAAIAARPVRLRGDGELFREDRRRLGEICAEDGNPPLATCLWVAQGLDWLARVDNELRAANLDPLVRLDRLGRHRILFEWLTSNAQHVAARRIFIEVLDYLKPGAWYRVMDFVRHATRTNAEKEQPTLKAAGGHYQYISPSAAPNSERNLARAIEETFSWLGAVDFFDDEGQGYFRLTELGQCLFTGEASAVLTKEFAGRKPELVVQPNFDVIVPLEEVDPLLTVPLDQFAERQSTGVATVYHLSKDSFTQAIQEGHDGGVFVAFLLAHNRGGGLPANVMTTLEDWRGGMKRVRLRTITVVESDDPLVLADILHRKRLTKYLTPLDPARTASYNKIGKSQITKELEKEGFVVE